MNFESVKINAEVIPLLSPELSVRTFEALTALMRSRIENPKDLGFVSDEKQKERNDEQRLYRLLVVRLQYEVMTVKISEEQNAPHP